MTYQDSIADCGLLSNPVPSSLPPSQICDPLPVMISWMEVPSGQSKTMGRKRKHVFANEYNSGTDVVLQRAMRVSQSL